MVSARRFQTRSLHNLWMCIRLWLIAMVFMMEALPGLAIVRRFQDLAWLGFWGLASVALSGKRSFSTGFSIWNLTQLFWKSERPVERDLGKIEGSHWRPAWRIPKRSLSMKWHLTWKIVDITFIFAPPRVECSLICGQCVVVVISANKSLCKIICTYSILVLFRVYFC